MYARHVTVKGSPEKVDAAVESVRSNVLPILEGCHGRTLPRAALDELVSRSGTPGAG